MNVMPIATPPPSPTGSPAPSGEGSAFADVMDQHLGEPRLSWEAANAVLDEVASPTVAPSDGLAALLAGLVGTAGTAPAPATAGTSAGSGKSLEPVAAGPSVGPAGAQSAVPAGAQSVGPAGARAAVPAGAQAAGPAEAAGAEAARSVVGSAVPAGAPEVARTTGAPGTSPATVGTVTPHAVALAAGEVRPGSAEGVGRGPVRSAAASTGLGLALPGAAGSAVGGVGAPVVGASLSQPGPTEGDASSTGDEAALTEVSAVGTAAVDGAGAEHGAATGADRAPLPAVGGPAGVSSATAGLTTGEVAEGAPGAAVTDQVFDHVTRLVSRGDGTHRLILKLHPADLGEVQIVLSVKDGTVDVTLSAGAAAREVLREGSPQLRALLEMTGATSGHVVVRELGTGGGGTGAAQQQAAGFGSEQRQAGNHTGADQASTDAPGDLDDAAGGGDAAGDGGDRAAGGSTGDPSGVAERSATPRSATAESAARRTPADDAGSTVPLSTPRVDLNL